MGLLYKVRNTYSLDPDYALYEILEDRGVEDLESFIHPTKECANSPFLLDNIEKGINLLKSHVKDKICIVVDADGDGFCSSSLLWIYLHKIYPNINMEFVVQDGKRHGLEHFVENFIYNNHYDLIICPDSASNDLEYIKKLQEVKTDVLVIDHHQCEYDGYDCLPSNMVLINNQQSKRYPNKNICGAGVTLKFCEAFDEIEDVSYAKSLFDLAALGEIADVMNKTVSETNYLIEKGLHNIQTPIIEKILQAQAGSLKEKSIPPYTGLTSTDISFYVAPLINAVVRVGTIDDNRVMFHAFINPYYEVDSTKRGAKPGEKEYAYEQFLRTAANCRSKQNRIKDGALETLQNRIEENNLNKNAIIVVTLSRDDDIPPSMRGLIASNLVSYYSRPVLIGSINNKNELCGSIRGNDNFAALPDLKSFLDKTGMFNELHGHPNAGAYVLPYDKLDDFTSLCNSTFKKEDFDNCYVVDYAISIDNAAITPLFYSLAKHPEYFGNGIDEIKIAVTNIPLNNRSVMGKDCSSTKITANGIDFVRFKDFDFVEATEQRGNMNIVGRINLNNFMGRTSIQVFIDDYEIITTMVEKDYNF